MSKKKNKNIDDLDINFGSMADLVKMVNELNTKFDPILDHKEKQEFLANIKKIREENSNNAKPIDNSDINDDLSNMADIVNESNFQSEPLIDNQENIEFIDKIKKFKNNNHDKQNNSVNFLNLGINFDPLSDKQDTREFIDKIKHKMKKSKPENIDNTQNSSDNKVKSSKKLKKN